MATEEQQPLEEMQPKNIYAQPNTGILLKHQQQLRRLADPSEQSRTMAASCREQHKQVTNSDQQHAEQP